ncbi:MULTISPECIES: haloacid dehalogenase-like hydrolase [Streptomyces]|uniref:Haloacid dehalogenase-like hydrolase n=1 Tax=Streptomyces flaveolus TaxID=67297 RepID=A0ABV1VEF1_9ACTN
MVLDLDGTVHPGTVGAALLRHLLTIDVVRRDAAAEEALAAIAGRGGVEVPHHTTAQVVYANYAAAVEGMNHQVLQNAARLAWQSCRGGVFAFVRPLVAAAIENGYETVLISGSPAEVVEWAAADLGVAHCYGARARVVDGHCDGRLTRAPGLPGQKARCLAELGERVPLDLLRSVALGNGCSDDEVLAMVGHPIAFEPEPEFATVAIDRGWALADRTTALGACLEAMAVSGPGPGQ